MSCFVSDIINDDVLNQFKVFTFSVDINNEEEFESTFFQVTTIRHYLENNNIKYNYKEELINNSRMKYTINKE